jgi:predicted dehydrogenase/threonine dehydrogenase-like Zn-dependent dehydrogenase
MLQIVQNMGTGETALQNAPAPALHRGGVLIRTTHSLISAGTERMLVEFGQASLLQKARQQPEKVRMVLDKIRTDGFLATLDAVRSKLDQPIPLGYCNAGVVLAVGADVTEFKPGDRVVSNGGHAGVVSVPRNLCARIPEGVAGDAAAFTVLASIGLQGVRLAEPTLGETVVVTGLGLIGLVTVQLLRAQGCRVIGIDFDERRLALAREFGASTIHAGDGTDVVATAMELTGDRGVDAVIITASTKSSDPVTHAARMSRKRGRIVLVGVIGLELNRADFYEKELTFQVSCSYGPGRYDPAYESGGHDYPLAFVRWTEQRNFEAILALMSDGRLNVARLISKRYPIENALEAYQTLTADPTALGIVLEYPASDVFPPRRVTLSPGAAVQTPSAAGEPVVGFIGAGNYASRILIPAFKAAGARLETLVTNTGASGVHHGRKAGFATASTQVDDVLNDASINVVAIVTRHDSHAGLAVRALQAGKHVFVEKPLALTLDDLAAIDAARGGAAQKGLAPLLMVGFNRRFAPMAVKMRALLRTVAGPKAISYTCNAGAIPATHWTQDPKTGGGRIVGEACHFIDLARHLIGAPIIESRIVTMGTGSAGEPGDKAIITLKFADGSIGTIQYLANGGKVFPKERVEVFAGNAVLQLDNFVSLRGFGWPGFSKMRSWKQDKGQQACAAAFLDAVRQGAPAPIPPEELLEVSRVSIELAQRQVHGSGSS